MEMYKPRDIFIGFVDFFGIVLPGVILAFWARPVADSYLLVKVLSVPSAPEAQALFFVTASIFLGHLAYGLGYGLESAWKMLVKRLGAPRRMSERSYVQRAVQVLSQLGHDKADAASKRYCTILIAKHDERAAGNIERLFALARFFRSFSAIFMVIIIAGGTPNKQAMLAWSEHPESLALVASLFMGSFVAYLFYQRMHEKAVFRSILAIFTASKVSPAASRISPE